MASQTETGKAFEYACLNAFYFALSRNQHVVVDENQAFKTAYAHYCSIENVLQHKINLAAMAAVNKILMLEPQMENPQGNSPLIMMIQDDAKGIAGDVRDVLFKREQNSWEIGLSCKHNHSAVKHSRLSNRIDFGQQWFGKPCSEYYFDEIKPVFDELSFLKSVGALWRDLPDKEIRFYIPLLNAFKNELFRLDQTYPGEIPSALVAYLIGRNDFYKVIARDQNRLTEIQIFNMNGTLHKSSGPASPGFRPVPLKLPTRIFDISYVPGSNNTVIITCDCGWAVSLRIHNASSKVETSLKFDINLIGTPNLGSIVELGQIKLSKFNRVKHIGANTFGI